MAPSRLGAGPFHRAPDAASADRRNSSPPAPRPPPLITPRCAKWSLHAPRQSGIQAPSSRISCQLRTTHHTCLGGRRDARTPRLRLSRKAVTAPAPPQLRATPPPSCSAWATHHGSSQPPRQPPQKNAHRQPARIKKPSTSRASRQAGRRVKRCPRSGLCSFVGLRLSGSDLLASAPPLRERLTRHPLAAIGT